MRLISSRDAIGGENLRLERSPERELACGYLGGDTVLVKRDTGFVAMVVLIVLTVALLAASVKNEGCLPWQERVGRSDSSRCDGSWFPFGWAALPLPQVAP